MDLFREAGLKAALLYQHLHVNKFIAIDSILALETALEAVSSPPELSSESFKYLIRPLDLLA